MKVLIVLPCYNEAKILAKNITKLFYFCQKNIKQEFNIIIADNFSNDNTSQIAKSLAQKFHSVKYFRLNQKGKGMAIKKAWQEHKSDYYVFMDMDLSTDIIALPQTLNILQTNQVDIVIGSRYLKESKSTRSLFRLFVSKSYNFLIKFLFACKIKDMANGFKAVNQAVVSQILPLTTNNKWFFDSEMVLIASIKGLKIKEIPIKWEDSMERIPRINVLKTSLEYIKELVKLKIRKIFQNI